MAMRCELTGKSFQTGNNVSHAKNRTKRRFLPNLQNITFISEKLGQKIQLKVAASTIRTVEKKGGLDDFLVSTPNSKLPEKAKKLKKTILSKTLPNAKDMMGGSVIIGRDKE